MTSNLLLCVRHRLAPAHDGLYKTLLQSKSETLRINLLSPET
jgi:hypothetical protein